MKQLTIKQVLRNPKQFRPIVQYSTKMVKEITIYLTSFDRLERDARRKEIEARFKQFRPDLRLRFVE
jgi:hypothetical protein